jgi:outer membrane protein assembly factor BamB
MMRRTGLLLIVLVVQGLFAEGAADNRDRTNWPQWRGPSFNGMAPTDAPTTWSDTVNVKWKADVPGRGHSTPIIWGDRIFLTTAIQTGKTAPAQPAPAQPASAQPAPAEGAPASGTPQEGGRNRRGGGFGGGATGPQAEHRFEVMCLDRRSGKVLWRRTAKVAAPHEGYHRAYGSFASNSPVTDGRYVYASFGSRGIYCFDFDGKLIWDKDLAVQMRMRLQFGEGTAPVLDGDRLIITFDQEGGSFIIALDKKSGRELWKTPRDEGSSWSTPLVVEHQGRRQIIVSATNRVRSYDVQTGKLIWECAGLGANTIPAPVHQDGVVYVMSGFRNPRLMAIKLGREGDLTGSNAILWSHTRGLSYTASPVLHENKLYLVTDNGMVSCFNATTGEQYFSQVRLPKSYNFKASPVGAAGKLYLATEDGDVVVLKMGDKFEVLATNTLEDQVFIASPIIVGGEIYLRSQNRLYCISEKK